MTASKWSATCADRLAGEHLRVLVRLGDRLGVVRPARARARDSRPPRTGSPSGPSCSAAATGRGRTRPACLPDAFARSTCSASRMSSAVRALADSMVVVMSDPPGDAIGVTRRLTSVRRSGGGDGRSRDPNLLRLGMGQQRHRDPRTRRRLLLAQRVPHGQVSQRWYFSTVTGAIGAAARIHAAQYDAEIRGAAILFSICFTAGARTNRDGTRRVTSISSWTT